MLSFVPIAITAFLPAGGRPAVATAVAMSRRAPVTMLQLPSVEIALGVPPLEAYPSEVVGVVELLFLAGAILTYYISAKVARVVASRADPSRPQSTLQLPGQPLPSLESLLNGCYCVVRKEDQHAWYLCATPMGEHCEPDEDFSAFYGRPVYVCRVSAWLSA
jgi:hypothetical protein